MYWSGARRRRTRPRLASATPRGDSALWTHPTPGSVSLRTWCAAGRGRVLVLEGIRAGDSVGSVAPWGAQYSTEPAPS